MNHLEALQKIIKLQEEKIAELEKQLKEKATISITNSPFNGPSIQAKCSKCGNYRTFTVQCQNESNVDLSRFNR